MATNFIQEGKALDYTAFGSDISSGSLVIIGTIAGIAKTDIADGSKGAVHISGVFSLPKTSGSIIQGQKLYWTGTQITLSNSTANKFIGVAAEAAASGDANVKVLLNMGNS